MSIFHTARATVAPRHFALALAVCFTFIFYGLALFPVEWSLAHSRHAAWSLTIGFSNTLLIFLCLANSRWSFVLGVPPLLVACTLGGYVQWRWGVVIDSNVMGALLEADSYETKTFLTWDMWLLLLGSAAVGIAISALYVKWCWYRQSWVRGFQHAYILFALAVALAFATHQFEGSETDFDDMFEWAPAIVMGAALFFFVKPSHLGWVGRTAVWVGLVAMGLLALSYAGSQETLWMVLCAGGLMGAWSVCSARDKLSEKGCAHVSAAHTLGMAVLLMPALIDGVMSDTLWPVNLVAAAAAHVDDLYYVSQARKTKLDLTTLNGAAADIPDKQLVVVLVVGESARADHFGLNGYARATTPRLAATPGLVSFSNARSCASATRISVPCLLTRATELDSKRSSDETSLISMFRRFGFDTAWISTNQIYGTYDTPVTAVANEAQRQIFPITMQNFQHGALDEELLEPFRKFLARPSPRKLVVLHQRGSHWHYHDRYPPAFQKFTPTCHGNTSPSACKVTQLINGYDNSILYTDHVLGSVIGALGEQNALFLYTSDHGQSLGEDGYFTHGAPERLEQRHVPMMWWASDSFRQQHPAVMSTLLTKRRQPVSHDHVFHSVLGCAGFHGSVIDESMNLCAP
ncbi:MAG: DUF1705 domain-containing protein [Limnohabitans sp.]|nr:DUF1705 domain-containing protein [Limnohabitans sp.]